MNCNLQVGVDESQHPLAYFPEAVDGGGDASGIGEEDEGPFGISPAPVPIDRNEDFLDFLFEGVSGPKRRETLPVSFSEGDGEAPFFNPENMDWWVEHVFESRDASALFLAAEPLAKLLIKQYKKEGKSLSELSRSIGRSSSFFFSVAKQSPEKFCCFHALGSGDLILGLSIWNQRVEERVVALRDCYNALSSEEKERFLTLVWREGVYDKRYARRAVMSLLSLPEKMKRQEVHRTDTLVVSGILHDLIQSMTEDKF